MAPLPLLVIGNKNYSSWSLRAWLALRWGGIDFEERVIPLGEPVASQRKEGALPPQAARRRSPPFRAGYSDGLLGGETYGTGANPAILAVSPTGRVPVLHLGEVRLAESLAICEWAAEQAPSLWPADALVRAEARSVSAEMHAGFAALRRDLSMNLRRRLPRMPDLPADTLRDLDRLFERWSSLRARFADRGPWLLGERSIADAMFAPVVTRLRTYAVPVPTSLDAYCATVLADAAMRGWEEAARGEPWMIAETDGLYR